MIYLDNSATTFVKPKNIQRTMSNALNIFTANPGRSGHKQSIKTALAVENVRELVANYVNTSPEKIIFTLNCTDALNSAILGTHKKGGHIVCTVNEHNSVLRPLQHLKEIDSDFSFTVAEQSKSGGIVWEDIENCLQDNTYLVIVNHISNVNGDIADLKTIGTELKKRNILFLVDGAQSGGHFKYDMQEMGINLLTFAPHKGFYSPQGIGCLCLNGDFEISPIRFGGTGTNSISTLQPNDIPEGFESGTLPMPNIVGLDAGINFVRANFEKIVHKIDDFSTLLNYELNNIENVKVFTHPDNANGVLAFNIGDIASNEVAEILDKKFKIMVRSGLHCAPLKHKHLGTLQQGAVRASLGAFSKFSDVERLVKAVRRLAVSN